MEIVIIVLLLLFALPFIPAGADTEAGGQGEELLGSVEDLLGSLDTEELEKYLATLTEQQRELFGGSFSDKILSVINGDFSLDYGNAFSALLGTVYRYGSVSPPREVCLYESGVS